MVSGGRGQTALKKRSCISKIIFYGVIFVLLFLCPVLANAEENLRAAKITELTGEVSVLKAGGEKPIKAFKNMSLTQGDTIITGKIQKPLWSLTTTLPCM